MQTTVRIVSRGDASILLADNCVVLAFPAADGSALADEASAATRHRQVTSIRQYASWSFE
jgi:hypothetical protein